MCSCQKFRKNRSQNFKVQVGSCRKAPDPTHRPTNQTHTYSHSHTSSRTRPHTFCTNGFDGNDRAASDAPHPGSSPGSLSLPRATGAAEAAVPGQGHAGVCVCVCVCPIFAPLQAVVEAGPDSGSRTCRDLPLVISATSAPSGLAFGGYSPCSEGVAIHRMADFLGSQLV